jgi:hypothetical protein
MRMNQRAAPIQNCATVHFTLLFLRVVFHAPFLVLRKDWYQAVGTKRTQPSTAAGPKNTINDHRTHLPRRRTYG